LIGAGFSAAISYSVATLYQIIVFSKFSGISPGDFLMNRGDIKRVVSEVKEYFKGSEVPEKH
jgi:hypothetical protein